MTNTFTQNRITNGSEQESEATLPVSLFRAVKCFGVQTSLNAESGCSQDNVSESCVLALNEVEKFGAVPIWVISF